MATTNGSADLQAGVSFVQSGYTDFPVSICIVNPNPATSRMQNMLSDDYTRSKNSDIFALLYGAGTEVQNIRNTLKQMVANNYLYSSYSQTGGIAVDGPGNYLVEFEIPFVVPPLNITLSTNEADAYIDSSSNYSMVITVLSAGQNVIDWQADGYVGAVTTELLWDALYNNFGSIYNLPRLGPAVINDSYVSLYEKFNLFISAESVQPVYNFSDGSPTVPPLNAFRGILRQTSVVTTPQASFELIDNSGQLLALLSFAGPPTMKMPNGLTLTVPASSYTPSGIAALYPTATNYEVYVSGPSTTFDFSRWKQPSFRQEVFRADNEYRRMLAGLRNSLIQGPNELGIANMVETMFSQPFIPSDLWDESDYRIFANTPGTSSPKYLTFTKSASGIITDVAAQTQHDGYPTVPPTVGVHRVLSAWAPDTITYNNAPEIELVEDVPTYQITNLNQATRFDITNEFVRDLRLGLDLPEGGIMNWNYLLDGQIPSTGQPFYENGYLGLDTNYVFLNNPTDSVSGLNIFFFRKLTDAFGAATGYQALGPLVYGQDYRVVATADLYDQASGKYALPSDLLALHNYRADASIPYAATAASANPTFWTGTQGTMSLPASSLPPIPAYVLKIDLRRFSNQTKFPVSAQDFILYSYANVTVQNGYVQGNFSTDPVSGIIEYCDADTLSALQPSQSPFSPYNSFALAQGSFARFTSDSNYRYITSMIGGNVTYNKTIPVNSLLTQNNVSLNEPSLAAPVLYQFIATNFIPFPNNGTPYFGLGYGVNPRDYTLTGTVTKRPNYIQNQDGDYAVEDDNGNVIAILSRQSTENLQYYVGQKFYIQGSISSLIWDTRIPVGDYREVAPIFQASDNFGAVAMTFTPDPTKVRSENMNFQVIINELPEGFEQTVTASWTFSIIETAQAVSVSNQAIGFSDFVYTDPNTGIQTTIEGIMSIYTGNSFVRQYGKDPDGCTYSQSYMAPNVNAYFLNYKDTTATVYGDGIPATRLGTNGDSQLLDTLSNTFTMPNNVGTVLNFFSPRYGFFALSILPGMEFFLPNGQPVDIVRPNNMGLALKILGDSYAGLSFYGATGEKIIDKPTRCLVNFQFGASDGSRRNKVVQIEDNSYANWVNGSDPDNVMSGAAFYIAGNEFKYAGRGFDQANLDGIPKDAYSLVANPPMYEVTSSNTAVSTPGQPLRYRRPPQLVTDYFNTTPEKISFLKFYMDDFPVDTVVNRAELEVYFCSGFTIRQAIHNNMTLNKNSLGPKARLSGNGTSAYKNVHWRKNFFEIMLPYAFYSEPQNPSYGINGSVFQINDNVNVPKPTFPDSNLEFLGFVNVDEIDTLSLADRSSNIEESVGLANIILNANSVIQQVTGILDFEMDGNGNISISQNSTGTIQDVSLQNVLPNMKVLVYPFGNDSKNSSIFLYGYVKSVMPPSPIGFTDLNISIYEQMFDLVRPLYSQYVFKLLEADTYFPYTSFGKDTSISGTPQDISF